MLDFKETNGFCTFNRRNHPFGLFKEPSLEDAYLKITGKELAD
jgi:hypothetical protein